MLDPKPWYQSRGIIGAIVAVIAGVAAIAGVAIDEESSLALTDLLLGLGSIVGGLLAWYGRIKANRPIGKVDPNALSMLAFPLAMVLVVLLGGCAALGLIAPQDTAEGITYAKSQVIGLKQLNTSLLSRDRIHVDGAMKNHARLDQIWRDLTTAESLLARGLPRDAAALLGTVTTALLELERSLNGEPK